MNTSRYFSLVTYATEKQIMKIMKKHNSSVRAFCYIHHYKEEAEPHYHVLIRTYNTWTVKQICRWFELLKDDKNEFINTLGEIAQDMDGLKLYILHQDKQSIIDGKPRYEKEDVKDYGYKDLTDRKSSVDNTYEIVNACILGINPRVLVRKYGRDFVYHCGQYYEVADRIYDFESRQLAKSKALTDYGTNMLPIECIEEIL